MNKVDNALKDCKRIAVVGAGEIGSRHLQALSSIGIACKVDVFDRSNAALGISRDRFKDVCGSTSQAVEVSYSTDISTMNQHVDLLILATTSRGREELLRKILSKSQVDNIILEKVLFQNPDSYKRMNLLFQDEDINVWVNCWPRTMPFFKRIKNKVKDAGCIEVSVSGGNWGLGCNSAHFLDLFIFLTERLDIASVNCAFSKIYDAKRKGYVDFIGQISIENEVGDKLFMSDSGRAGFPITVKVSGGDVSFELVDKISDMKIIELSTGQESVSVEHMPYQSERTGLIAREILLNHTSDLPLYSETYHVHARLIQEMLDSINRDYCKGWNLCPIT